MGDPDITLWLREAGLAAPDEEVTVTPLSGGVSSDVFRVDLASGPICVKRALPQLRVAADWRAPVERSGYEAAWLRAVKGLGGPVVPEVLAEDPDRHLFAMTWFEPTDHPVWKAELAQGRVDPAFAGRVGRALARVHARTANSEKLAAAFATDALFSSLRLDPYILHTAQAHADLAPRLQAIVQRTLETKTALVHGDVSPKNILVGPMGPVFLDAECAWYGDPAFDIAFCANHLLLKSVWKPAHATAYAASYRELTRSYLDGVIWEDPEALDGRAAPLLAALLLARIDGKSPVEYLTSEADKAMVRSVAIRLLQGEAKTLAAVGETWNARGR